MPSYQNIAIDAKKFLEFADSPTDAQVELFVELLGENRQATSFFMDEPPSWKDQPFEWVSQRITESDWYRDLTEPEIVAWEHAILHLLDNDHFQYRGPNLRKMEHGTASFSLLQYLAEGYSREGRLCQAGNMHPFRFHGLPIEILSVDPAARIFWPSHALLDTAQMEKLVDELRDFKFRTRDATFDSNEIRSEYEKEASELILFLSDLIDNSALWFARIDC